MFIKNNKINKTEDNENKFHFEESSQLKIFFVKLYISSLINNHICCEGPTGKGKTITAIECSKYSSLDYQIHNFHSETKPYHFFGLEKSFLDLSEGNIIISAKEGKFFIADEFNLCEISTMESLIPLINMIPNIKVYIPGIEEPIKIHENFFFIACQNNIGNEGRKNIPLSLKLQKVEYPNINNDEEIGLICEKINDDIYEIYKINNENLQKINNSKKFGKFMLEFNKLEIKGINKFL